MSHQFISHKMFCMKVPRIVMVFLWCMNILIWYSSVAIDLASICKADSYISSHRLLCLYQRRKLKKLKYNSNQKTTQHMRNIPKFCPTLNSTIHKIYIFVLYFPSVRYKRLQECKKAKYQNQFSCQHLYFLSD